jgi:CHAT domain-containing protein
MNSGLKRGAADAWEQGQWTAALKLHLELVHGFLSEFERELPEVSADYYLALERVAYLAALFGKVEEADQILHGLTELCRNRGLDLDADRASMQRVHLALGRGNSARVRELLDAMSPTLGDVFDATTLETTPSGMVRWEREREWGGAGDRHAFFAQFYLEMGCLAAEFYGNFTLAAVMLRRGMHHASSRFSADAARFSTPLRLALSQTFIDSGDLRSARRELAIARLQIHEPREPGQAVREKELRSAIYMLAGKFGACVNQLRELVNFLRGQSLERAALRAQLNLAHAQIFLLQTVEARHSLELVAAEGHRMGETDLTRQAEQLMLLADWQVRRCAPESAPSVRSMRTGTSPSDGKRLDSRLLALPLAGGLFLERLGNGAVAFRNALEVGDAIRAKRILSDIRDSFGESDSALVQTRILTLEARLLAFRKEYDPANAVLRRALGELRALGLEPELSLTLVVAAECAEQAGLQEESRRYIEESLYLMDDMARSLPAPERLMLSLGQVAIEEKGLCLQLDRLSSLPDGAAPEDTWIEVDVILTSIEAHKRLLYEDVLGHPTSGRVGGGSTRRIDCPVNRAVVTFAVLEDRVLLVCYSREAFQFRVRSVGRRQVREIVAQWHSSRWQSKDGPSATSQALPELLGLFELTQALPAGVNELIFVPDDSLHGFPFATLRDDKGYLIERYAISVAHRTPGGPVAPVKVKRPVLAASKCGTPIYQVPDPVNDVAWLAEWFPGVRQLAAEEMNRRNLLQILPDADLLHLVCHGEFSCDHPEKTGLVAVPRWGVAELVSLTDLAGLKLSGVQHATLVACWGADNYVLPGRWVLGLAQMLCWSGAGSVLASLWPANAVIANRFIKRFYANARETPRNEALRLTQLEFLQHGRPLADWAGWQLCGDTGQIQF